jgi:hypothetical protein
MLATISVLSLATCLVVPMLYFHGAIGEATYKQALTAASLVWFMAAPAWATRKSG